MQFITTLTEISGTTKENLTTFSHFIGGFSSLLLLRLVVEHGKLINDPWHIGIEREIQTAEARDREC